MLTGFIFGAHEAGTLGTRWVRVNVKGNATKIVVVLLTI